MNGDNSGRPSPLTPFSVPLQLDPQRNVLGPVASSGWRCIALDLIGMGGSGKPDIGYRLADHAAFLDAFLDTLQLPSVILIGHDRGAVLAIDLLGRRPQRVRAVAFLEGHLHPIDSWDDMDAGGRELFGGLRTPEVGERMVATDNTMVELVLPSGVVGNLTAEDMAAYRAPFLRPEDRLPTLRWAREIPIAGEPDDVVQLVTRNQHVLATSPVPRLLLHGSPGAVVGEDEVDWCRRNCPGLTVVDVGPGTHFLPEDHPEEIAAALNDWLAAMRAGSGPGRR